MTNVSSLLHPLPHASGRKFISLLQKEKSFYKTEKEKENIALPSHILGSWGKPDECFLGWKLKLKPQAVSWGSPQLCPPRC